MSAQGWLVAAVALIALMTADARAGLFRCERPDGSVIYTDNQSACPGAKPHEPRGVVHSIDTTASTGRPLPASARKPVPLGPADDNAAEAQWRNKKHQTEREFEQLTLQTDQMEPHLRICNRGGYLFMTQDNGLKKKVSCDSLRAAFAELESRRASLHEYLEHGLMDECRRAGCLPGWLR